MHTIKDALIYNILEVLVHPGSMVQYIVNPNIYFLHCCKVSQTSHLRYPLLRSRHATGQRTKRIRSMRVATLENECSTFIAKNMKLLEKDRTLFRKTCVVSPSRIKSKFSNNKDCFSFNYAFVTQGEEDFVIKLFKGH